MSMPFPGMDPYLENPILWTGVHSRLINSISSQIAPALRPRYVVSIEERVVIDIPHQQRVPDLWIQKTPSGAGLNPTSPSVVLAEPLVMEMANDAVREPYIEILDRYQDLQVVTVLELRSPINKTSGPGREQYLKKRSETLNSSTHLVEIDLLRTGARSHDFTEAQLRALGAFDYLISVNRSRGLHHEASRTRVEFFPCQLRKRLPAFGLPLVLPDPDVALDLQAALDRVYEQLHATDQLHSALPPQPIRRRPSVGTRVLDRLPCHSRRVVWLTELLIATSHSNSSSDRGQSSFRRRLSDRSAKIRPSVWQRGQ